MVNKIFINSYLEKISKKFNITIDKAFEVFSISSFLDKSFDDVFNDIIIKNGDGGIDGAYIEENGNSYILHIFQCKNTKTLKVRELEYFKQCIKSIFNDSRMDKPDTEGLNKIFEEYKMLSNENYVEIKKYFLFNGDINDDETYNEKIFKTENDIPDNFSIIDINKIGSLISKSIEKKLNREDINFSFKAVKSNLTEREPQAIVSYNILNVKAANFRLSAIELCKLYDMEVKINGSGDTLFSENVRGFLGYNKTNKKIKETLNDPNSSEYFPYFNNGITIICPDMTLPTNSQLGKYIIPVKNPIIVNGLQTTQIIYETYQNDPTLLEGVYVTIKLFQTTDQKIIDKITEATNTQSAINYKDKISNKNFQKYVKEFFKNKNIAYLNKRGNIFSDKLLKDSLSDSIGSDKIIKFWYASFFEKPDIAKNSISKVLEVIFDATNGDHPLKVLFNGSLDSPIYNQLYMSYKILSVVTKKRLLNEHKKDFIDHIDELMTYGIYKNISENNLSFNDENIINSYPKILKTIEKIIRTEKSIRKNNNKLYSHSIYFKSSKSKVDYNTKTNIIENYNLCDHLMNLNITDEDTKKKTTKKKAVAKKRGLLRKKIIKNLHLKNNLKLVELNN